MAKKDKVQTLTQFKHLRFFDQSEGETLNNGGFTLAFRAKTVPTENVGVPRIEVSFAFAECSIEDNFNKARGRGIAYGRLQKMAEGFSDTFELTDLPEGFQTHLIQLGDGQVDIKTEVYDVSRAVIEYFLLNFADALNVGSSEAGSYGNMLENLLTVGGGDGSGTVMIDASILDYEEPTIESAMTEAAVSIKEISNECIDKLDSIDLNDAGAAQEAIASVRSALASIIDVCSSVTAAEDELDDESDDEEADELDTDEDDGGTDDEDESDDEDGDDEEGDEDEGDDNPR